MEIIAIWDGVLLEVAITEQGRCDVMYALWHCLAVEGACSGSKVLGGVPHRWL